MKKVKYITLCFILVTNAGWSQLKEKPLDSKPVIIGKPRGGVNEMPGPGGPPPPTGPLPVRPKKKTLFTPELREQLDSKIKKSATQSETSVESQKAVSSGLASLPSERAKSDELELIATGVLAANKDSSFMSTTDAEKIIQLLPESKVQGREGIR